MPFDIHCFDYGEAIFRYVGQPDIFEDFCHKSIDNVLSLAEYVERYKLDEFKKWLSENFPQLLSET